MTPSAWDLWRIDPCTLSTVLRFAPRGEPEHELISEPELGQEDGLVPEGNSEGELEENPEVEDELEEEDDPALGEFSDAESCVTERE